MKPSVGHQNYMSCTNPGEDFKNTASGLPPLHQSSPRVTHVANHSRSGAKTKHVQMHHRQKRQRFVHVKLSTIHVQRFHLPPQNPTWRPIETLTRPIELRKKHASAFHCWL